ncbi:MAG: 3-methyl-2-oxobutanoate hydroxymethyltransferase, partial [Gemmatimonadaceae bacterium]
RVAERAGVDVVLVGDSAAMTMLGYPSTREVSLEEMLMLTRAARRGVTHPLLIGDMPFGTYESSDRLAVASAKKFADAGCAGVKIEGAGPMLARVRAMTAVGIPVMGHVGLKPQGVTNAEEYRARGRTADEAMTIIQDAVALEEAGAFSIVVEAVASPVVDALMTRVDIPVIGIGAGPAPDGQVLVYHDLVGWTETRPAKFVRKYAAVGELMVEAVTAYAAEVRAHRYPAPEHMYGMSADELARFKERTSR